MVQIITDSSTLYTSEEAQKLGFEATPLSVSIGDMNGRDLLVDMDDFYERIAKGEIPQSSQPPIGDVMEVYEKYPEDEIINIAMADGLSGTYQSACGARESVDNKENITVFNSRTLCGPHRYMVQRAQQMKEEGKTAKDILEWLKKASHTTDSFLIPQDFAFLKRGGRLTPVAAALGSVLKLKPIMTLTEDCKKLDKFGIKRTMKAAVNSVIDEMKGRKLGSNHIFYVVHARAKADAEAIAAQIRETFQAEVQMYELSPVFVTQGGPQCIAIQYIERM